MIEPEQRKARPGAKLLIDLGPLVVFFLVNAFAPVPSILRIFYATGAFMAAMLAAMLASQILFRKISAMLWFSGVMVVVLGGLTIWLHNETFIKMKPTVYYLTVSALLAFGLATGRNLLEMALGSTYPGLSDKGWRILTRNWAIFFVGMAIVNEAVWRSTTTGFWVGFKLWGALPATLLFGVANVPMLLRHGLNLEQVANDPPVAPPE